MSGTDDIEKRTGLETRVTVLGHLQRGGTLCAFDRVLATRFETESVRLLVRGMFGTMVCLRGNDICSVKIGKAVNKLRRISPRSELVKMAKLDCFSFTRPGVAGPPSPSKGRGELNTEGVRLPALMSLVPREGRGRYLPVMLY